MEDEIDEELEELVMPRVESLLKYEGVIVDRREQLIHAFESSLKGDNTISETAELSTQIAVALRQTDEDEEFQNAANALISIFRNLNPDILRILQKAGASDELIEILIALRMDYRLDIERLNNQKNIGQNWWSTINTEIAIRSDQVIFNHEIVLDMDDVVEFSTSFDNSTILVNHLLRRMADVIDMFGDESAGQIDEAHLEVIEENIERIRDAQERLEQKEDEENVNT
ncbi:cysteine--tRNA ligase [Haloferax volcanii]|uniref:Uncharacterized protein n=1 Tax=Haloferax volcanii TaxID=2246 RepID=A0A558G9V7_HALVO|nr:hypothetical protein [Haloferax volcanii]TVT94548.1 hypothetical protein FQA18_11345 [Haloferax volcanii]